MATTVAVVIGSSTVSNDVRHIEIWEEESAGVGRFIVDIDNQGGTYNGTFNVNDAVNIDIAGADFMDGLVDYVRPIVDDDPDVFRQLIRVGGRSKGRWLIDITVDKYYTQQESNLIIEDLLTNVSGVTYTATSGAILMSYDSKDERVLNSLRKITERSDQSFYVDGAGALQLFDVGSQSSGITLKSVAGATDNNIIRLERDAAEGTDIANYIIIRGKDVTDGWTEFNASDWNVAGGEGTNTPAAATNDTNTVTDGVASIKFTKNAATASWIELDFSGELYGRTSLDWRKLISGEMSFKAFYAAGVGATGLRVRLTDTAGNVIEWRYGSWFGSVFPASQWNVVTIPIGTNTKIVRIAGPAADKTWRFISGTTFTWNVEKIRIEMPGATTFYVDGLTLPAKMFSIQQDATSQTNYGVRHYKEEKRDIESQVELDAYATKVLAKRKDPLVMLNVTADGAAGVSGGNNNWKPGYTCVVNIPDEGINSVTYRMISFHHTFDTDAPMNGYDFWTEVTLTPSTTDLDMDRYEALNEDVALLRELREALTRLEQEEEGEDDAYPALPRPVSEMWLLSSNQWQQFWEADKSPISISTATDGVAAGTSTVSDNSATEDVAILRLGVGTAAAASGRMFGSDAIVPPGTGEYIAYLRIKVASTASSSTVLTFNVYDDDAASNVGTLALAPSDFSAANTYEFWGVRVNFWERHSYRFRGEFVTGITDVYVDWIGVTDAPVPEGVQLTTTDSHAGASNVAVGTHTHSISGEETTVAPAVDLTSGYLPTGLEQVGAISGRVITTYKTLYAHVSGSTASSLESFVAVKGVSSPNTFYYGSLNNYVIITYTEDGWTQQHTHTVVGTTAGGGDHTHTQVQPDDHTVTNPQHKH